ncbi:hypothetical protein [Promicromonospora sukumoe]|uniref:hypothetical protein n=1 Tax=Promicromonospora sukumoe TaxID=88382 RepID=UPI003650289D
MYPDWLPEALAPVAARLARVDDCYAEIAELSGRWSTEALQLKQLHRSDDQVRTVIDKVRPIPPAIAVLFSDAINHLRATLDNVVWHLVTSQSGEIADRAALSVALPIHDDVERFENWASRVRRQVPELAQETSTTYQRVRALQPFVDSARIPSIPPALAALVGVEVEEVHPLLLLQAYSNLDKHRAIALMVGRMMITPLGVSYPAQDRFFREMGPGSTVGPDGKWGTPVPIESNAAVMVERPAPWAAAVSPAAEVMRLRDWVCHEALPYLVTGSREATPPVPVTIELGDDGRTLRERISVPSRASGFERTSAINAELLAAAGTKPWKFPLVVKEEFED